MILCYAYKKKGLIETDSNFFFFFELLNNKMHNQYYKLNFFMNNI